MPASQRLSRLATPGFDGALASAAADLVSGASVVVSQDGGQTCQPPVGGLGYCRDATVTAAPSDPRTAHLFCVGRAAGTRLFASHDGGVTWQQLNPPAPPVFDANSGVHQIAIDRYSANDIWVRTLSSDGPDSPGSHGRRRSGLDDIGPGTVERAGLRGVECDGLSVESAAPPPSLPGLTAA